MKKFKLLVLMSVLMSTAIFSAEIELGEEYIKPLKFPKFSASSDFTLGRNFIGIARRSVQIPLDNRFDVALSFEAGIYKYMNAGVIFSGSISQIETKGEPLDFRFGLFAKPYFPIGDRVAFFGRIAGGLAVAMSINSSAINFYRNLNEQGMSDIYKNQDYFGWPFGAFGSASVGIEVFPFSRFGIALEGGIRASIFRNHRNIPLVSRRANNIAGAPSAFHFLTYEWPISVMLHGIL